MERIDVVIEGRNNASPAFREVTTEIGNTEKAAQNASRGGEDGFRRWVSSANDLLAIYHQVREALSTVNEVMREGAISLQLGDVLEDYSAAANTNAEAVVSAAKKASSGTIAEFDLMLQANRAFQFEVAKTPEGMSKLIELSTALGRAQGVSDTQALEFLTSGIARESKLILDNLGLMIDVEQATDDYAQTLGKTAEMLSSAERKTSLLNAAYAQSTVALQANADASESAATSLERMDASWKDLRVTIGEGLAAGFAETISDIAEGLGILRDRLNNGDDRSADSLIDQLTKLREERRKLQEEQGFDIFGSAIAISEEALANLTARITELEKRLLSAREAQGIYNDVTNQTSDGMLSAEKSTIAFGDAAYSAAMASEHLGAASLDGAEGLSQMEAMAWSTSASLDAVAQAAYRASFVGDRLQGLRGAAVSQAESLALRAIQAGADPEATIAQFGDLADQIQNTSLSMENSNEATLRNKYLLGQLRPEYESIWQGAIDLEQANERAARSTGKLSDEAKQAQKEFNKLYGEVQSVLGEALNVDVGVDVDKIIPREDAINEPARRLADIAVNGFKSPWVSYFQTEFPALWQEFFSGVGDETGLKQNAAQLLKNFQDGLNPEMIDKEKAKDRVRRILLGDQNMAALAKEIAAELSAEFGSSLSVADIQSATDEALGTSLSAASAAASSASGSAAQNVFNGISASVNVDALKASLNLEPLVEQASTQVQQLGTSIRTGLISSLDGVADVVSTNLSKQFEAEDVLKKLDESGQTAGKMWATGFATSAKELPPMILEILASLLGPYVESINSRNATLVGAN